jgi:STE24 endopeptidase
MGSSGSRPSGVVRPRHRIARFRLWRAVTAAPAVIGSLLLLTLASGGLGRWAGLLLLTWAVCAAVLMTRVGERVTVRVACRFRSPSPVQAAVLKPAWATALQVTGAAAGAVELYVQTARVPNAYAAGGRSVAVTSLVLEDYESGRLPEDQLVAVLVHELGHHATGAARPMLLVSFLAAPWRLAASLLTGLASILAGRQPRRGVAVVVVAGVVMAVARALHQGQWVAGGVLAFVGLAALLCPLADAALSRRSEIAADRFAADHGLALELAAALHAIDDGRGVAAGWSRRLLASHPTAEQRICALRAATESSSSGARLRPRAGIVTGRPG